MRRAEGESGAAPCWMDQASFPRLPGLGQLPPGTTLCLFKDSGSLNG